MNERSRPPVRRHRHNHPPLDIMPPMPRPRPEPVAPPPPKIIVVDQSAGGCADLLGWFVAAGAVTVLVVWWIFPLLMFLLGR